MATIFAKTELISKEELRRGLSPRQPPLSRAAVGAFPTALLPSAGP
jgi:hypothetical protein